MNRKKVINTLVLSIFCAYTAIANRDAIEVAEEQINRGTAASIHYHKKLAQPNNATNKWNKQHGVQPNAYGVRYVPTPSHFGAWVPGIGSYHFMGHDTSRVDKKKYYQEVAAAKEKHEAENAPKAKVGVQRKEPVSVASSENYENKTDLSFPLGIFSWLSTNCLP